ncbi:MAG: hypothetical protein J5672_01225 [Verrucomicrobia bacterium]|nr:hypothetical protein [Verrucomicrobiota bacterium]
MADYKKNNAEIIAKVPLYENARNNGTRSPTYKNPAPMPIIKPAKKEQFKKK